MASLVRWNPMRDMMRLGFNLDPFFHGFKDFMEPEEGTDWTYCTPPAVESFRHDGSYVVKMDLPGVDPKDVHLNFADGYLTIEGERKRTHEVGEDEILRDEVCYGSFRRSLYIPEGIKSDMIKAKYHEGVLEITAPIDEKFMPRKIEVEEVKN